MSSKGVLSIGDALLTVNYLLVGPGNGDVNVEEAPFGDLKGETKLGASVDPIKEAFFGVGVDDNKVGLR